MRLEPSTVLDYPAMAGIIAKVDPSHPLLESPLKIQGFMEHNSTFLLRNEEGGLVGFISFFDFLPDCEISAIAFIDPEHEGGWMVKRDFYKPLLEYCFDTLDAPRLTYFTVDGTNDNTGRFLKVLGFQHEGTMRRKWQTLDGRLLDLHIFSLLREERRDRPADLPAFVAMAAGLRSDSI